MESLGRGVSEDPLPPLANRLADSAYTQKEEAVHPGERRFYTDEKMTRVVGDLFVANREEYYRLRLTLLGFEIDFYLEYKFTHTQDFEPIRCVLELFKQPECFLWRCLTPHIQ